MNRALVLVAVIGCGPGLRPRGETREVGRDALVAASGNAAALRKLLRDTVVNGGLWFDDASCSEFAKSGEIAGSRLEAFATCLATLPLQASAREDALGDVVVVEYAPGFELEARVVHELAGPRLTWIGYASQRPERSEAPTVTSAAIEARRLTGDRNGPPAPEAIVELELTAKSERHNFSWIKFCIDDAGAVTEATPFETVSRKSSDAFVAAVRTWKFRPFVLRGQTIPVCSMVRMAYPPDNAPAVETLPLPPPPSKSKHPTVVLAQNARFTQGSRIYGEKLIVPDEATKSAIHEARVPRILGSFRFCLDDTGKVESVLPMRSTGYADYDRKIIAAIRAWRYSPYKVDEQAVPVCSAVTFIYSQR